MILQLAAATIVMAYSFKVTPSPVADVDIGAHEILSGTLPGDVSQEPRFDISVFPRKPKFSVRHPKVYKVYRVGRHAVLVLDPFVKFAGSLAQCLVYIVPRK